MSKTIAIIKTAVIVFLCFFVFGALLFVYIYKFRKKKSPDEDTVDYSGLARRDAKDYLKFDTIKDGIIVMGYTFTAGIVCYGCDYWSLPASERLSIKKGYQSFMSTIKEPVTYRQSAKAIDLDTQIQRYSKRLAQVEKEVMNLSLDYEEMKAESTRVKSTGDYEGLAVLVEAMERTARQIEVGNAKIKHLQDQISYQHALSNGITRTDREEVYLFSWTYQPKENEPILPDDELFTKAKREIKNLARVYISALSNAHVKARQCTQTEIEMMMYRHFHPLTGQAIRYVNYIDNSDSTDVVKADDSALYDEARKEVLDRLDIRIGLDDYSDGASSAAAAGDSAAGDNTAPKKADDSDRKKEVESGRQDTPDVSGLKKDRNPKNVHMSDKGKGQGRQMGKKNQVVIDNSYERKEQSRKGEDAGDDEELFLDK